jgi:hypothetical protein
MNETQLPTPLPTEDLEDLRLAKRKLESPSLTVELAALIGQPLEAGMKLLPKRFSGQVHAISQAALLRAIDIAVGSLGREPMAQKLKTGKREAMHRWMTVGSGAIGGAVGLWSLPIEIPISTTLILRSIAEIAREEGHDLSRLDIRMACLEVFALGGASNKDNAAESSYWLIRGSLSKAFADAATHLTQRGMVAEGAPPLVRLATTLASRFSVNISAQAAAKAIPLISAATGATINLLFMQHFQEMARGHFIVKRLEAKYGSETVQAVYSDLQV